MRAGSSAFQQYTSDKATLLKAADKIRWYPPQGSCAQTDGSFNEAARSNVFLKRTSEGAVPITIESEAERKIREYREDSISRNQVVGTLGVFRYAVSGLERAPGRKSMFVLSDGLPLRDRDNRRNDAAEVMRELTDAANRAGVVVHTFSLRGSSISGMVESKDEVYVEDNFNATEPISRDRIDQETRLTDGLQTLAYDTGSEFYKPSGIPDKLVSRILEKESGYYLLAYEPDENTFRSKKFNSIDVKVKVPELRISHRSGFLAAVDTEPVKRRAKSAESDLYDAIAAPLARAGLSIDLTAYFGVAPTGESFVRALFHLDGRKLTFADDGPQKKLVLDVVAVTLDENNDVIDEFNRTHRLKVDVATAARINRDGLIYSTNVPVKKSGSYNFRVAVRDQKSKTLGTAAQIVQIPDLKRSDIFLAGLTVAGVDAAGKFETPAATTAATAERITRDGLSYSTDVPIKNPGSYTFRVAVRDGNSRLIGSSSQVVQIPDLKRSGVFLSGLSIAGVDEKGNFQKLGPTTAENAIGLPASKAVPSIRRFKRGSVVAYSYSIYNASTETSGKPNLTLQVNLYKNGALIVEGSPAPLKLDGQPDLARINDFAYIRLTQTEPGEYALQLIVRDLNAGKTAVSSQWVDFEVVDK